MKPIYITREDLDLLRKLVAERLRVVKTAPKSLQKLEGELNRATVVDTAGLPPDVVALHSRVTLRDLETGEVEEWVLTLPEHADPARQRLSILAPVGTGILGFAEGDEIEWETPGGTRRLLLEQVTHEAPVKTDVLAAILG
ncbi:MAG: GreA/GreB family elongation factor [Opitutales bacterium]|nr:GreA/GreB family elongation factor [Opitutales bacterium]